MLHPNYGNNMNNKYTHLQPSWTLQPPQAINTRRKLIEATQKLGHSLKDLTYAYPIYGQPKNYATLQQLTDIIAKTMPISRHDNNNKLLPRVTSIPPRVDPTPLQVYPTPPRVKQMPLRVDPTPSRIAQEWIMAFNHAFHSPITQTMHC